MFYIYLLVSDVGDRQKKSLCSHSSNGKIRVALYGGGKRVTTPANDITAPAELH